MPGSALVRGIHAYELAVIKGGGSPLSYLCFSLHHEAVCDYLGFRVLVAWGVAEVSCTVYTWNGVIERVVRFIRRMASLLSVKIELEIL